MCGRLNVTDSPGVRSLCEQLQIDLWPQEGMLLHRFTRAASSASIVVANQDSSVSMVNAIWWLLLDKVKSPTGDKFKPSKYTSFNTRYDKLNVPRSAGYQSFRSGRCLVPVAGFGETQTDHPNNPYHDFMPADGSGMLLGGLYRQWHGVDAFSQPFTTISFSVVTLPAHPQLMKYHRKASPLMLSLKDNSAQRWLDCSKYGPELLEDLLTPCIRQDLSVVPIDRPSTFQVCGPVEEVSAD